MDAIDAAYDSPSTPGYLVGDILRELAPLLELLHEPQASLRSERLGGAVDELGDNTERIELLQSSIESMLDMLDIDDFDAEAEEYKVWVDANKGKKLLFVPKGMSRDFAEEILATAAKKLPKDPA